MRTVKNFLKLATEAIRAAKNIKSEKEFYDVKEKYSKLLSDADPRGHHDLDAKERMAVDTWRFKEKEAEKQCRLAWRKFHKTLGDSFKRLNLPVKPLKRNFKEFAYNVSWWNGNQGYSYGTEKDFRVRDYVHKDENVYWIPQEKLYDKNGIAYNWVTSDKLEKFCKPKMTKEEAEKALKAYRNTLSLKENVINKIESFLSEAYEKTQGSKMELGEYYYRFQEVKEQLKNSKTGHEFWKNVEKCKEFFQWARGYLEKKIYSGNAAKFINVTKEAEADLMKIAKTFAKPNFAKLQDVNNIDFYEYVDRGKLMGLKDDERANRASSAWHRFD